MSFAPHFAHRGASPSSATCVCLHSGQTLRFATRAMRISGSASISSTASMSVIEEMASAWASVLGKPSRMKPFRQSSCEILSSTMAQIISSGTRLPLSMIAFACMPRFVCKAISARSMSPVEICASAYFSAIASACVPLPAAGGPKRISFIFNTMALHGKVFLCHVRSFLFGI